MGLTQLSVTQPGAQAAQKVRGRTPATGLSLPALQQPSLLPATAPGQHRPTRGRSDHRPAKELPANNSHQLV